MHHRINACFCLIFRTNEKQGENSDADAEAYAYGEYDGDDEDDGNTGSLAMHSIHLLVISVIATLVKTYRVIFQVILNEL